MLPGGSVGIRMSFLIHAGGEGVGGRHCSGLRHLCDLWQVTVSLCDLFSSPVKESESEVAQSCPTHCDPMDCSLSGSFVHGIFQARVLEWIAISFSRGASQPRN